MKRASRLAIVGALLALIAGAAQAGPFDAWSQRAKITFQGYTKPGTLNNFTVLVKISPSNISGLQYSQFLSTGGADLRFADSNDTAELAYEVEEWNPGGESIVWVKVPRIAGPTDYIYAYWGRSGQSFPSYTTDGSAWTNRHFGVWHLRTSEDAAGIGTVGLYKNSASNGWHGTDNITAIGKTGLADGGQQFSQGSSDYIALSARRGLPNGLTFMAWVKTTNPDKTWAYEGDAALNVFGDSTGSIYLGFGVHDRKARYNHYGAGWIAATGLTDVADGAWHQIAVTHSNTSPYNATIFTDGKKDKTKAINAYNTANAAVNRIGTGYGADYFDGNLDELRIYNGTLSTNWIWACWSNMAANTSFNLYGAATAVGGKPIIDNAAPTNINRSAAGLKGYLSDTGTTVTTVSVYWGTADGGAPTSGLWQSTNTFAAGAWGAGSYPVTNVALATSNVWYYYRFSASNGAGARWALSSQSFLGGDVWITAPDAAASEVGPDEGVFRIQRHPDATNKAITVSFALAGSASYPTDYSISPASLSVVLPAGKASTNITVNPTQDPDPLEGSEDATLVLKPGLYGTGSPSSNTVAIADGPAAVVTNTTLASGSWSTAGTWSLGRAPLAGDFVAVRHNVVIGVATPYIQDFDIQNATLTFTNWTAQLTATNVTIKSGGKFTASGPYPVGLMSNRVNVVCRDFTVDSGGSIDVDSRGYSEGYGPGLGQTYGSYAGGSGHGGYGGRGYYFDSVGGGAYDSVTAPLMPGSGGIAAGLPAHSGAGGGAVRIAASGAVTLNGTITANGGTVPLADYWAAGGSGGSIYITCSALGGAGGLLRANGGTTGKYSGYWYSGSGGGGRIAVHYSSVAGTPALKFQAAGGTNVFSAGGYFAGTAAYPIGPTEYEDGWERFRAEDGTVWLPDTALLAPTLKDGAFFGVRLYGPSAWSPGTLNVSTCEVTFAQSGFALNVAGEAVIGKNGRIGVGYLNDTARPTLRCSQSVTLTNGGALVVYAGKTNGVAENWGGLLSVTGNVRVASTSKLKVYSHETDGGSVLMDVSNLVVQAGGRITAKGKGYACNNGPGTGGNYSVYGSGAGHGGRGGRTYYYGCTPGAVCGSAALPLQPGSGGGDPTANRRYSGKGGGAVRVLARGSIAVDGTVSADGGAAEPVYGTGGGGAGGSVYLRCATLLGAGTVSAAGGCGSYYSGALYGAGAGGGRMAMDYQTLGTPRNLRFVASPGLGMFSRNGGWHGMTATHKTWIRQFESEMGTLYLPDTNLLSEVLNQYTDVRVILAGLSSWTVNQLTVTNASVAFDAPQFRLNVNNDLVVGAGGKLAIGAYEVLSTNNGFQLNVAGNLVVNNGGGLYVYGGRTNGIAESYGTLVDVGGDVAIAAGSWIYPSSHQTDGGSACFRMQDLSVAPGSGFDADWNGFAVGCGPGTDTANALGYYSGGGGHGGSGGRGYYGWIPGGPACGQAARPWMPGSGAGLRNNLTPGASTAVGANGGGAIRIEADGNVTLQGTLTANGGYPPQTDMSWYWASGGAGGGIDVRCQTFDGSGGVIQANGGNGGKYNVPTTDFYAGGGGGGRIALVYQAAAGSPPRFSTAAGKGIANRAGYPWDSWRRHAADDGTVFLPDTTYLASPINGRRFVGANLLVSNLSAYTVGSLAVSNCSLNFVGSGFKLTVNSSLVVGRDGSLGIGAYPGNADGTGYELACPGSLVITNGGQLHVYSGKTNGIAASYGALVDVDGPFTIGGTNSWLCPYSHENDGGSVLIRAHNLAITTTNAGINATGRGFAALRGYGKAPSPYYNTNGYSGGGGYGGRGGNGYYEYAGYDAGGPSYGSSNAPTAPGSGAGGVYGGWGGGLVRIEAGGTLTLNGTIAADGGRWSFFQGDGFMFAGGGSGGGIYLQCLKVAGSAQGRISAKGGDAAPYTPWFYCGAGGGGRIAAYFNRDQYLGSRSVVTGQYGFAASPPADRAANGTIVWRNVAKRGTVVFLM